MEILLLLAQRMILVIPFQFFSQQKAQMTKKKNSFVYAFFALFVKKLIPWIASSASLRFSKEMN